MSKKQPKARKRQIVNCLSTQLRLNGSLTMFAQTLYKAIKRFRSHFPREVIYVEKAITADLEFFLCKIFKQIRKECRALNIALLKKFILRSIILFNTFGIMAIETENYYHRNYSS